jgi:predicted transcriptional regulator
MRIAMNEATLTFRVDEALKDQFTNAAKNRDRTAAQLLRDFMRDFVSQQQTSSYDTWLRDQVQMGLESAKAGRLIPADKVEAEFKARRMATKRKISAKA